MGSGKAAMEIMRAVFGKGKARAEGRFSERVASP